MSFDSETTYYPSAPAYSSYDMSERKFIELDQDLVDFEDQLIREREESIIQIQQQMKDVNHLFKEVSDMVNDQAPKLDSIQQAISNAGEHTTVAEQELKKANKTIKEKRKNTAIAAGVGTGALVAIGAVLALVFGLKPH